MPDDSLTDPRQVLDGLACEREQIGLDSPQQERALDDDLFQRTADDSRPQSDKVARDVGQFGHVRR